MQSGYGGVSEMQQFLVDGCAPTLFSISPPPQPPENSAGGPGIHTGDSTPTLKYHPLHHPHHHPQPHHQPPPPSAAAAAAAMHFPHFNPIPITQQLFQQSHHQFQLFHHHHHPHQQPEQRRMIPPHHHQHQQQHLGLDQESGRENSSSPTRMMGSRGGASGGGGGGGGGGSPSFLAAAMNFKLAVNESSGGGSRDALNDEEGILHDDDGSESRFHPWQREEEPSIKEPFWRPLDIDYINRNNKRCKDKEPETSTNAYCKKSKDGNDPGNNYKLFSELEAIYKPGGSTTAAAVGGNNQTGSGSVLTGDENPLVAAAVPMPAGDPHASTGEHGSDTSTGGGEPPANKFPKSGSGRRKRKRRQQLSSIAAFFEGLVKQLMDHQEGLHRKFLEVMERRDRERTSREEAWRRQESAKSSREAADRASERDLAADREAAIISFLEKITGETLNLPTKSQFQSQLLNESQKEENTDNNTMEAINANNADNSINQIQMNTSRWPRAEVQALIRVRSGLESRFQEPGLKGPLWEEVSTNMGSMGYHRSAKRCKEKWENINKYFRKTKDSGKKRPQQSKTCPYFHLLDQLYNKPMIDKPPPPPSYSSPPIGNTTSIARERRDNSELLDAIVVSTDNPTFKFPEMGSMRIEFKGGDGEFAGKGNNDEEGDADADDNEEGGDEEEGEGEEEGESQDLWQQRIHS